MRAATDAEMRAIGASLLGRLKPGDIVHLSGPMGAGKTTLVRGYLEAAGWEGAVRSPTFALVHEYPLQSPVAHIDLYRVPSPEGLDLEDLLETHILFIEWPDRAEGWLPDPSLSLDLQMQEDGSRLVQGLKA